jgi:hypothetical protein
MIKEKLKEAQFNQCEIISFSNNPFSLGFVSLNQNL